MKANKSLKVASLSASSLSGFFLTPVELSLIMQPTNQMNNLQEKGSYMMCIHKWLYTAFFILVVAGCAQVPKDSVELSATVGRDVAEIEQAHLALVQLYFGEKLADVDRFVDSEYKPYQIRESLKAFKAEIAEASRYLLNDNSSDAEKQNGLDVFSVYLEEVNNSVEEFRQELRQPLVDQRDQLIVDLEKAYSNVHYANSIVTGHLASIVKVHDTQDEVLAKLDMGDLRTRLGIKLNETSVKIEEITEKGEKLSVKVDKLNKLIK